MTSLRDIGVPAAVLTIVLVMIALQVVVGATMVLHGLPRVLQAAHVAVGAAVWASVVLAASAEKEKAPPEPGPHPTERVGDAMGG